MSGLLTTCDIYKKNQLNFNRRVIFPWLAQLLELWRSSSRILSWDQIHLSRANSKLMTNLQKLLIRDGALEPLTWLPSSTNHNPIQTHQEKVLDSDGNRKHSKSVDPLLTVSKTARHWILWKELRGGDRLRLKRGKSILFSRTLSQYLLLIPTLFFSTQNVCSLWFWQMTTQWTD